MVVMVWTTARVEVMVVDMVDMVDMVDKLVRTTEDLEAARWRSWYHQRGWRRRRWR